MYAKKHSPPPTPPFEGLKLGRMLSHSEGVKVYQGRYRGSSVIVRVRRHACLSNLHSVTSAGGVFCCYIDSLRWAAHRHAACHECAGGLQHFPGHLQHVGLCAVSPIGGTQPCQSQISSYITSTALANSGLHTPAMFGQDTQYTTSCPGC